MCKWEKKDWLGNRFEEDEKGNITNVNGEDEYRYDHGKDFLGNEIRTDIETGEKEYKVPGGWRKM